MNKAPKPVLDVTIRTRQKTLYSGSAQNISSTNVKGDFSILPMHANFITLIKDYVVVNKGLKDEQTFMLQKGLICVVGNKIEIYSGL